MGFNVVMTVFVVILFVILTPGIIFSLPTRGSIHSRAIVHGILFAILYHIIHKSLRVEGFRYHPPTPRGPCPGGYTITPDGVSCTSPTCPDGYTMSTDKTLCTRKSCPNGYSYTDKYKRQCGIVTCQAGWKMKSSDGHKYCSQPQYGWSKPTIFGPDLVDPNNDSQPTTIKTINAWA